DPAPGALAALHEHLGWLARTSPPIHADGLARAIAEVRGVPGESLALGAGSSDLIFRAFSRWLSPASRVLLLEPTYGEYDHVVRRVIGASVERLVLRREDGFRVPLDALRARLTSGDFDLAVAVNPNNPTGVHIPRRVLASILAEAHPRTRTWIDEAYTDYAGP